MSFVFINYFHNYIFIAISDEPVTVTLESCDDCMHFLWSDSCEYVIMTCIIW